MSTDLLERLQRYGIISCEAEPKGSGCQSFLFIRPHYLRKVVRTLDEESFFLEAINGLHVSEGIEVIYHFDHYQHRPGRISVRAVLPQEDPTMDSIADIYPGAEWHERENTDLFGVTFKGNPNPAPLLLSPEDPGPVLLKEEGKQKDLQSLLPEDLKLEILDENSSSDVNLKLWTATIQNQGSSK